MRKVLAFVVAMVTLALVGGSALVEPAVATPPAKISAAAAQAKAAQARAAALARTLANSGPRYRSAAATAARARTAAGVAATRASRDQVLALSAARASAAAAARSAAAQRAAKLAKANWKRVSASKASAKAKSAARQRSAVLGTAAQSARSMAKKASRAAVRAAKQFASSSRAAHRSAAHATATAGAARKAWLNYVALAAPRASAAARSAAAGASRAKVLARSAKLAKKRAANSARSAAVWQTRVRLANSRAARANAAYAKVRTNPRVAFRVKRALSLTAVSRTKAARAVAASNAKVAGVAHRDRSLARKAATAAALASSNARARQAAATRAKIAVGPNPGWRPSDRVVFNNPKGSKRQQLAIIREINAAIDATPAGGEIRMAQYLFNIDSVATKLIAAHRRGASVQLIVDDGELRRPLRKVRKALGTDKRSRSFVATCDRSCMSSGASTIHAKFYLFSVAGQARYVSMISSANPYTGNTFNSWNNNHTIVGNQQIYDSLNRYFTDMLADRDNPNYYRVTSSGKYTIYLYPQVIRRPNDVVLLNVLNRVSCATTGKGFGSKGRTLIRVANWGWTSSRMDIAKRLWQLHNSGCRVQVMINKGRISKAIVKQLLVPSKKYGQMPVYDAWHDYNLNDAAGLYLHHKMITVNGLLDRRNVKITWTGSQNFTRLAASANNDIILRVIDARVTNAYEANFAYIRSHYTHRMRKVPLTTGRLKLTDGG